MKRYIVVILAVLCLASCDQSLDTWSGKDVVYFDAGRVDSTAVSFVYMEADVETYAVDLFVRYMGDVTVTDRTVAVRVVDGETTAIEGVDYQPLEAEYTLTAGNTYCYIPIVLVRNPSLLEAQKYITVELVKNRDFELYFPEEPLTATSDKMISKVRHKIYFTEMMIDPPRAWDNNFLGKFSPEKFLKICEVMELPRDTFNNWDYLTQGRLNYIGIAMNRYLQEMRDAGTPVLEKDGSEMTMGSWSA